MTKGAARLEDQKWVGIVEIIRCGNKLIIARSMPIVSFASLRRRPLFWCCDVSSTRHFVKLPFCQLFVSPICHIVKLLINKLDIVSTYSFFSMYCFINGTFAQIAASVCHFVNLLFRQLDISSNCFFINFQISQFTVLLTLPFYQFIVL
jgi:hypothetical protein